LVFGCFHRPAAAQNYSAVNGSPYNTSLGVHNNPASIVNSPLKWDLTILGLQEKHTTNIVKVYNYSLLSSPAKSEYLFAPGNYSRFGYLNANINLLNARLAIDRRSAIAFGVNIKSYVSVKSSPYNFIDTIGDFADFFKLNPGLRNLSADVSTASWAEIYASYGRTVREDAASRLNAGITLKVNRGLSGAFLNLAGGAFEREGGADPNRFVATQADIDAGYSSNYDEFENKGQGNKARNFLTNTLGGASVDLGLEYIIKLPDGAGAMSNEVNYDYDWKFGLSLLDLGFTQYKFGKYSTRLRDLKPGILDSVLDQTFDRGIDDAQTLRDTLASLYDNVANYIGTFRINNPTRLVLNVDKFIDQAFYINADISIDLSAVGGDRRTVKDLNLLTVTPRWETKKLGFYLPFYYNNRNQAWVGGAARVGPVLFGLHNWANLLSKKKSQRGGLYFAITLRAPGYREAKGDKRLDCPPTNF